MFNDESPKPLRGVRVLDCGVLFSGPLLTSLLAQYGAEVTKVEAMPLGDLTRQLPDSNLHEFINAGKKSIAVNLKIRSGTEIVKKLAESVDVFVENLADGVMDRFGLGYVDLSAHNPNLIYVSIRAVRGGQAFAPTYDLNSVARSGCGEWFLESGHPNYSTFFGLMVGGVMTPAIKLLAHLSSPKRRGMHLVCTMEEGFRILYLPRAYEMQGAAELPADEAGEFGIHRLRDGALPHSRFYRAAEGGWLALDAWRAKEWENFCEAIGKPSWRERGYDPSLSRDVEGLIAEAPAERWEALAKEKAIPLSRVVPWAEHFSHPVLKNQLKQDPWAWAGFPAAKATPAPALGADTFALLTTHGFDNRQISDWMKAGIVGNK